MRMKARCQDHRANKLTLMPLNLKTNRPVYPILNKNRLPLTAKPCLSKLIEPKFRWSAVKINQLTVRTC